jgi:hypothetical protein
VLFPYLLAADSYRRAEEPYDPERFSATVGLFAAGRVLGFVVRVRKPDLVVRRDDDPDPRLDNEPPDIHSDGLQCYFDVDGWQGFLLVPVPGSPAVRVRPVAGTAADPDRLTASWLPLSDGYAVLVQFNLGREARRGDEIPVNLVVNQMLPGRQRRAGQLALSGGGGWVYLRGDREPPGSAVIAEVR